VINSFLCEHFDNPYEAHEALAALVEHFEWEYHCYGFMDIWRWSDDATRRGGQPGGNVFSVAGQGNANKAGRAH
jgi:hypothetical protein